MSSSTGARCVSSRAPGRRYFAARAKAARELSDLLGQDHDCAVLKAYLEDRTRCALSAKDASRFASPCRARQKELRRLARPRGERLYVERAGDLAQRVHGYWQAARDIASAESDRAGDDGGQAVTPPPAAAPAPPAAKRAKPSTRSRSRT